MTTAAIDPDRPLVSVMMPARNVATVVADTIRSVLAQTYAEWELIFVDDGSTDATLDVVQAFAAKDKRIRVFALPHGGRGRARNACIERASGSLIAVCDADDISFPDRFAKQVRFLQDNPDIGAVAAWWIPFSTPKPPENGPVRRFPTKPQVLRRAFARGKMRFHNATVMMRRSLFDDFGGYHPEQRRAQDYEFFARVNRAGVKLAALPEPLLFYRQDRNIPSLAYSLENGMFMAFADRLLAGDNQPFERFAMSPKGRFWSVYYRLKYAYIYAKLRIQILFHA